MPNTKKEEVKETKTETKKEETKKTETPKVETAKTETSKTTETKTETNSSGKHPLYLDMTKWSLRKVAFLTIVALGVLHLVSAFLAIFNLQSIVSGLQAVASAIATAIVAVLSWSYAAERNKEWKIIYFICLLVVVIGIIVPLVF
jgi:hypothetical protein